MFPECRLMVYSAVASLIIKSFEGQVKERGTQVSLCVGNDAQIMITRKGAHWLIEPLNVLGLLYLQQIIGPLNEALAITLASAIDIFDSRNFLLN